MDYGATREADHQSKLYNKQNHFESWCRSNQADDSSDSDYSYIGPDDRQTVNSAKNICNIKNIFKGKINGLIDFRSIL